MTGSVSERTGDLSVNASFQQLCGSAISRKKAARTSGGFNHDVAKKSD